MGGLMSDDTMHLGEIKVSLFQGLCRIIKLIGISTNLRLVTVTYQAGRLQKNIMRLVKKKWKGNGEFMCISFINS